MNAFGWAKHLSDTYSLLTAGELETILSLQLSGKYGAADAALSEAVANQLDEAGNAEIGFKAGAAAMLALR